MRGTDRVAFLYLPLFFLVECGACYLILWLTEWPEELRAYRLEAQHKLDRYSIGLGVFIGVLWIIQGWRRRAPALSGDRSA